MTRVSYGVLFALASAVSVACALVTDLGGLGGADAGTDASTPCGAAGACFAAHVPPTWTPIAYHENFIGCPSGFVSQKYVTKPTVACACGCSVTAQSTCDVGDVDTFFGPNCASKGVIVNVSGGCTLIAGSLDNDFEATPIAPTGGKCDVTTTPSTTTLTAEACIPGQCADAVCQGIVPGGFKACVIAAGDVACPTGTPFSVATSVGASVSTTCDVGCTCAVKASCANPTIEFFSDSACKTSIVKYPADGTCTTSNQLSMVASTKYTATESTSCDAGGASAPSVSFTEPHTICCAP